MAERPAFIRWFCAVSVLTGSAVMCRVATAAPADQARLSWVRADGASTCPGVEVVRDGVVKKLGYSPFGDDASKSFEVVAKRAGRSWQANIYSYDTQKRTSGFREIQSDGDDCAELVNAVALALALAIDPDKTFAAPSSPPPSPAASPPAPAPYPHVAASADRKPSPAAAAVLPPARWRTSISARGISALGALPRAAAGAAIAATAYGPTRVAVSAGAWLLPSVRSDSSPPVFGFGLTAAWLDGCFVLHEGATAIRACAGVRVGALHAVVYSPIPTEPGDRFWWAMGAGLAAEQQLFGPVFVEVGVEAAMPLVHYRFFAENFEPTVFEQARAIGMGFAGIGFRID